MKQIFGVSAFGLKDCIAGPNQVCKEEGFLLQTRFFQSHH